MKILLLLLFVLASSIAAAAQSELPDKGKASDLADKTAYYLDAEADQAKMIRRALKGSDLKEVDKAADADFVIEFRILSQKEKPQIGGLFPASDTVRRAQMQVYYFRDGRKVIAFSDVKEGGDFSRPAAMSLPKRFLEERSSKH